MKCILGAVLFLTMPQPQVIDWCERTGALPHSRACGAPGWLLMPTFETALTSYGTPMSREEYTYTFNHEYNHACNGLPPER